MVARLRSMKLAATPISEKQAWLAMAALSLGFFMSLLDQSMIAVALSDVRREFNADVNQVLWVSAIYLLAVVVPLLFTGRLGDIYGQKRMFQLGNGLFGLGALLCALSPSVEFLIAARALQGLGASIQMPQTMAVINRIFPRERRGRALGAWGVVGSLATLAGPLLGGLVVAAFGWQAVFWIHIPFVIAAIALSGLWVPALPTTPGRVDFVSVWASFIALTCFVFAVQQGPETGWPWWIWAFLAVGVLGMVIFVRLQSVRGMAALVPLVLFKDRNYSVGSVAIVSMGFMAASMMIPIMMWLQVEQGMSARDAGLIVTPMALVSLCVSPLAGILADKLHPRRLAVVGFGILISTFILLWFLMHAGVSAWWLSLPCAALGAGQSFIWGSNAATTMRDIDAHLMGAASGVYNTSRQVGSVIGVAGVSAVMQVAGAANSLVLIVAILAVGCVSSLFFRDTLHAGGGTARLQRSE
ncbi:permease of the major facilitator superfamily [Corynebacterium aurimucosum ATCC 700975]|uniref:Permease of the major facilitator superfamily n=2 Tax=Corynebacterium aurimucosum TaxID=169292 RepID=C3PFV4_CORA7|nr:permease of the major facilitator superfamily [Corynebacterium aurimucosum ATCC 700975]